MTRKCNVLQIPDSRPTAKQLLSLLKATERTAVGFDDSMGGRTFMMEGTCHKELRKSRGKDDTFVEMWMSVTRR